MSGSNRFRSTSLKAAIAVIVLSGAVSASAPAQAQDLLSSLFGALKPRAAVAAVPANADANPWKFLDKPARTRNDARASVPAQRSAASSMSPAEIASMDPLDDPTLRRGDIVVTRDGPVVYTGADRRKNRDAAFVPAQDYRGLPASLRKELSGMRVAKDPNESAWLPADVMPATSLPAHAADASPVAEAFASFKQ